MTDPSREAFEKWFVKHQQAEHPGISVADIRNHDLERCSTGDYCSEASQTAWAAWQAAMAHKGAELEQAHEARRQAQAELADMKEKRNRIGLDIDRALRGEVNEQSPIAGRLKLIAQKAGQWKPWPMG